MTSSLQSAAWSPGLPSDRAESSSPPRDSPSTTTRRRRGLSYLRSYTQTHLLSRDSQNSSSKSSPARTAAGSPPPPATASASAGGGQTSSPAATTAPTDPPPQPLSPPVHRTTTYPPPTTSNQLLTLGERSPLFPAVSELCGVPTSTTARTSPPEIDPSSSSTDPAPPSNPTASPSRPRAATAGNITDMPQSEGGGASRLRTDAPATAAAQEAPHGMAHQLPSIRFSAHQDPRAQRPSLVFSPQSRILPSGKEVIKVGRWSERDNRTQPAVNVPSAAPVGFKSKVVSRRHCEFWCTGGRWYIKDVKSSSGTFLNHIRLSSPGTESKPFPINDGDIVQLGIDFKGGEEMIFRCVKIRVELNKGWQTAPSSFNVQSHKRLQELNNHGPPAAGSNSQDCSICLGSIAPCQSLFVAPCSHTWHYKCIRVIINGPHWPHFICPNCRTVADLEAELDDPRADGEWEQLEGAEASSAVQTPDAVNDTEAAHAGRQTDSTEATNVSLQPSPEVESRERTPRSDGDGAEASDSDLNAGIQHSVEGMSYLNIDDSPIQPSSLSGPPVPDVSHSTVAPVNIAGRNGSTNIVGTSSRLENPDARASRGVRTPSPHDALSPSAADTAPSSEGPMTPRNDAGPFIFDGSAGRLAPSTPPQTEREPAL